MSSIAHRVSPLRLVTCKRRHASSSRDALKALEASGLCEVIPFSQAALDQAEAKALAASAVYSARERYPGDGILWSMLKVFTKSLFGEPLTTWNVIDIKALYLPLWHFHGAVRFDCKIQAQEQKKSYAVSTSTLSLPGYSWSPLDKMRYNLSAKQLEKLEPFNVEKHTADEITVLPFSRSPLTLAPTLKRLARERSDLVQASKIVEDEVEGCHDDERPVLQRAASMQFRFGPSSEESDQGAEDSETRVSILPDSVQTKLAAFPILVPVHLVEMEDTSSENIARHTLVMRADSESPGLRPGIKPFWSRWTLCDECGTHSWQPKLTDRTETVLMDKRDEEVEERLSTTRAFNIGPAVIVMSKPPSQPEDGDKLSPKEVRSAMGGLDAFFDIAAQLVVQNCVQRLIYAPRSSLGAGSVSSWADSPAIMRYSAHGQDTANSLDMDEFNEASWADLSPALVDLDNPPSAFTLKERQEGFAEEDNEDTKH